MRSRQRVLQGIVLLLCLFGVLMMVNYSRGFPKTRAISRNRESTYVKTVRGDKFSSIKSDRWIVVTTISYPTADVKFLAKIQGWKMVIVGDTKTPNDWSYPGCVYLSVDDQNKLGFETVPHLPTKSYARKNVGYLFAIAHGAKVIYETDDDNRPTDLLQNFVLAPNMSGLVYGGKNVFNPYRHFGQPTLWPRGYPLGSVGENITTEYHLGRWKTPSIQQGVVNGDPDMDAVFRLTRKKTLSMLNVTFDKGGPPAIVPAGVFSPFNSQNTLFLYDALWGMLIPTTTAFRVCDIWRGYWAQRLLWEMGGNLGFFPPNAFQKRNSHSYLLDAVDEKDLYFETERLLKFLKKWRCGRKKLFFDCVVALSNEMVTQEFWKEADAVLTNAWVNDLIFIGYKEPPRVPFESLKGGVEIITSPGTKASSTQVNYWPAVQPPPMIYKPEKPRRALMSLIQDVASLCRRKLNSTLKITFPTLTNSDLKTFPNILLIVVFKSNQFQNLNYLEVLYRKHFPHIVYCGDDRTRSRFDRASKLFKQPVTFIEVDLNKGLFGQRCLTEAMKMRYDVDGYLTTDDETVPNFWYLHKLPLDKAWRFKSTVPRVINDNAGGRAESFKAAALASRTLDTQRFSKFFSSLSSHTGKKDAFYNGWSAMVYVPRSFKDDFVYFTEHFTKHKLNFEATIPTVLAGVGGFKDIHKLTDKYLLYDGKQKSELESDNNNNNQKVSKLRKFICQTYLQWTLLHI